MKPQKFLRFTFFIIALAGFSLVTFGQSAPEKINYQAVARDDNGNVMSQATIDVYFTIMDANSNSVYEEEHSGVTTNDYGLFSLAIGDGNTQSGTFSDIDWGSGQHMVKVEVDDGSGYVSMGTSELNSVPYSLYAEESGTWQSGSGLIYNDDDKVFIGRSSEITAQEQFGIQTSGGGYGGMYIDTDQSDGQPFYGYATGGLEQAWTYYDGDSDKWHLFIDGSNKLSVQANGNVGIGNQSPEAPLDIAGGNWDLENSEGDLRIGGDTNRLKVSMATSGAGAGQARINAFGVNPQVRIGASANDILTVDSSGVGILTDDNNYPREEELHIVQDTSVGNNSVGLKLEQGPNAFNSGDSWGIGVSDLYTIAAGALPDLNFYFNDDLIAWVDHNTGEWNNTARAKTSTRESLYVLEKVLKLNPQKFYLNNNRNGEQESFYGFNTDNVSELFPSLVSKRGNRTGLSYNRFSVLSVKAIQEQQEIINNQKKQIQELQKELDEIKDALNEAGISVE